MVLPQHSVVLHNRLFSTIMVLPQHSMGWYQVNICTNTVILNSIAILGLKKSAYFKSSFSLPWPLSFLGMVRKGKVHPRVFWYQLTWRWYHELRCLLLASFPVGKQHNCMAQRWCWSCNLCSACEDLPKCPLGRKTLMQLIFHLIQLCVKLEKNNEAQLNQLNFQFSN